MVNRLLREIICTDIETLEDIATKHDLAIGTINELVPDALWILRGWEYSDLEWTDENKTKPTKTQFDAKQGIRRMNK